MKGSFKGTGGIKNNSGTGTAGGMKSSGWKKPAVGSKPSPKIPASQCTGPLGRVKDPNLGKVT
jgi:hypothetical protein